MHRNSEQFQVSIFGFINFVLYRKLSFIALLIVSIMVSYLTVLFTMKPQYDSSATLIPITQSELSGITSLISNFSAMLPSGASALAKESEMGLYNTIIMSRTSLELIGDKFGVQKLLKLKYRYEMVKSLQKMITISTTLDNAYIITVRSPSKQLSADMCNFIIDYLNNKVIELNTTKSKESRIFLEKRYSEMMKKLTVAEESLKAYQLRTGMIEAEGQAKGAIEFYSRLEADIVSKQLTYEITQKLQGEKSPEAEIAKVALDEYKNKYNSLYKGDNQRSTYSSISSIPQKLIEYYRIYRDVKILNETVAFLAPIVEQARIDEQKDIPVIQIIDRPVPAEKKAFPPRTLYGLIFGTSAALLTMVLMYLSRIISSSNNEQVALFRELLSFKSAKS